MASVQSYYSRTPKFFGGMNTYYISYETLESCHALVASKKNIHKKAVLRNRAKRRVRAAIIWIKQNTDLVFPLVFIIVLRNQTLHCSWNMLCNEIIKILKLSYEKLYNKNSLTKVH